MFNVCTYIFVDNSNNYVDCCEYLYIDITAALRAVFYIARVLACDIKYLPEGASPRRRYLRIARRAPRARVLYDNTARKREDDIVYIHQLAGIALNIARWWIYILIV